MGAGASAKKRGAEGKSKGVVRERGDQKAGVATSKGSAVVGTPGDVDGGQKGKGTQSEETSEAFEGVEDILCRLAQTYPTQTPERWELITKKLNRAMRNKKISAQPMKDIFAKEGLCIPQCWVAEKIQAEKDRALAQAQKSAEKKKGALGRSLFGKKKKKKKTAAAAVAGSDRKKTGEAQAVGEVKADEANETDTETESNEDVADDPAARTEGGQASVFQYKALSKYEVMVKLKRIHGNMMSAGGSFWDLGSGVGKCVIAAAMMHNWEVPKLNSVKAKIRVDFINADAMKQQGWMAEATLLFVHTNFSAKDIIEIRTKADGMKMGQV